MKWLLQITIMITLSVATAAIVSESIWGYPFFRPDVSSAIQEAGQINALIAVSDWRPVNSGTLQKSGEWQESIELARNHPYDTPEGRALIAWQDRGLLSADMKELPLETAAQALAAVQAFFPDGTNDYKSTAENRSAIVAQFDGSMGKNLVLVAARAGQHRNDHYAYREFILKPMDGGYQVLHQTGFQYDVAGIEGLEFPYLFALVFTSLVLLVGLFNLTAFLFRSSRPGSTPLVA